MRYNDDGGGAGRIARALDTRGWFGLFFYLLARLIAGVFWLDIRYSS